MDVGLKDKVALITGGANGLGKATAKLLASEGAIVIISDVNNDDGEKAATEINNDGGNATFIKINVTDPNNINSAVKEIISNYGRIDILVNNAAIVGPQGPWHLLEEKSFDAVVDVDFKGVFLLTKAVIPHMIKNKFGKIVFIGSNSGKTGEEYNGVYSCAKATLTNMAQSMSGELGKYNINVNTLNPSLMPTKMLDGAIKDRVRFFGITEEEFYKKIDEALKIPGFVPAEDVAKGVLFLCSNLSEKVTGQSINVGAGLEVH